MTSPSTTPTPRPSVRIDADSPGAPISPYIFSQFIEHLGRCIYGGIWAEMLDDRKFFHPVGAEASPWRVVGPASVQMDTREPFVGEHTPVVTLPDADTPSGLAQHGVSVQKGETYTGRLWLAGEAGAGPVSVSLVWADGPDGRETIIVSPVGPDYVKVPLRFTARAATENARLEVTSQGRGSFRVGTASLMPSANVRGLRPDVLELVKQLNSPLYRWPGGNFVSGYEWRDGIGDPDRRPPRKNPAWRGVEHNDFGVHEFLAFCDIVGAEPNIVVNTGFGDAFSAAQWVEYVNGTATTPMGRWRAANGRAEPWGVTWWSIGNEMFGTWQLGSMDVAHYALKHQDFERRMRKADPGIKTIGVGEHGPWSEAMMQACHGHMDLVSEHFYVFKPSDDVAAHVEAAPAMIREKVEAHRRYRREYPCLEGRDIRIAMDEWNYWYGPEPFGELGVRYAWKDAMGIAAGLHEYFRQSDIVTMAHYAQTVNVLGCIKATPTAAAFETAGLVLMLYRRHFGYIPLPVHGAPHHVDVAAALTADRATLTIGVVNATGREHAMDLSAGALKPNGTARRFQMASDDVMALNNPGTEPTVVVEEDAMAGWDGNLTVPPYSVTLCVVPVAG